MSLTDQFNQTKPLRELVLDIETTGLRVEDGHRIIEIGVVELIDGVPSGIEFHAVVNPGRHIPDEVVRIHGIDDAKVEDMGSFSAIAAQLRQFIGDDPVVITCRTTGDYTLDINFLNAEWRDARVDIVPDAQWKNVRRWSEEMFGHDAARLDAVLDRYGISRAEREEHGHSAILDARLLASAYVTLAKDYAAFQNGKPLPSDLHKKSGPKI